MIRASQIFGDEQKRAINAAVAAAERRTSAEIVPVVAAASGRYDRAEDIVGLWAAMAAVAVVHVTMPIEHGHPYGVGSWGDALVNWKLLTLIAVAVTAFVVGTVVAGRVWTLRHLFTPRRQMREETTARAEQAFFDSKIWRTRAGSGVLVYVSLYERRAVILADRATHEKLGQAALDRVCSQLTTTIAAGDVAEAMTRAITLLGEQLEPVLPRQEHDVNELPDGLVLMD